MLLDVVTETNREGTFKALTLSLCVDVAAEGAGRMHMIENQRLTCDSVCVCVSV